MFRLGEEEPPLRNQARELHETRRGQQNDRDADRMHARAQRHQHNRRDERGRKKSPFDPAQRARRFTVKELAQLECAGRETA